MLLLASGEVFLHVALSASALLIGHVRFHLVLRWRHADPPVSGPWRVLRRTDPCPRIRHTRCPGSVSGLTSLTICPSSGTKRSQLMSCHRRRRQSGQRSTPGSCSCLRSRTECRALHQQPYLQRQIVEDTRIHLIVKDRLPFCTYHLRPVWEKHEAPPHRGWVPRKLTHVSSASFLGWWTAHGGAASTAQSGSAEHRAIWPMLAQQVA